MASSDKLFAERALSFLRTAEATLVDASYYAGMANQPDISDLIDEIESDIKHAITILHNRIA